MDDDTAMQEPFRDRSQSKNLQAQQRVLSSKRTVADVFPLGDATRYLQESVTLRGHQTKRASSPISVNWRITAADHQADYRRAIRPDGHDEPIARNHESLKVQTSGQNSYGSKPEAVNTPSIECK
jgi:hypothetical protein